MSTKHKWIIIGVILVFVTGSFVLSDPPKFKHPRYFSEKWRDRGSDNCYSYDVYPSSGVFATVNIETNEPSKGYPMHSSHVVGVSDTIMIYVELHNRNTTGYDIRSMTPEQWFQPVIYNSQADIREDKPLPFPDGFGYQFYFWRELNTGKVAKPDTIPTETEIGKYSLQYLVWGIPNGRFRLVMEATEYLPQDVKLLVNYVNPVWITHPAVLQDSINAYTACFWRAFDNANYTEASTWFTNILSKNPYSVTGNLLKLYYAGYGSDSTYFEDTMDNLLQILEENLDPLLPDTLNMDIYTKAWYLDMINEVEVWKYEYENNLRYHHN